MTEQEVVERAGERLLEYTTHYCLYCKDMIGARTVKQLWQHRAYCKMLAEIGIWRMTI